MNAIKIGRNALQGERHSVGQLQLRIALLPSQDIAHVDGGSCWLQGELGRHASASYRDRCASGAGLQPQRLVVPDPKCYINSMREAHDAQGLRKCNWARD
jgi:hypothetical protein